MFRHPSLPLVILLLSFPQIVETIYSPALPMIASAYRATPQQAAQTLSLWFVAFAFGVVAWGRLCDIAGRRPALLGGLALYAVGSGWAMMAGDFGQLLMARLISAFGAAVGSIVTQTALRDSYRGTDLARVFSLLGMALAISPAIGMFAGQEIAKLAGHQGVFAALGLLAIVLLVLSLVFWPETRPAGARAARLLPTLNDMLRDRDIWLNSALIAIFNLTIFAYYQMGPFLFEGLKTRWFEFGESGLVLAAASLAGALANSALLQREWSAVQLVRLGVFLLSAGAGIVFIWSSSPVFMVGMAVIATAYALAIPNILAGALRNYTDRPGTAGALLSLLYYNLLGLGLVAAGFGQRLDLVLVACAMCTTLVVAIGSLSRR